MVLNLLHQRTIFKRLDALLSGETIRVKRLLDYPRKEKIKFGLRAMNFPFNL